ncbi:10717_t:CDS:10 [Ambispora leptoticha]|uniref:Carboxypeptidase n=1 Tax=Ambispora leptoticha TaxID=144679 RepID=A0A9N8VEH6_9GLOM|nr:10717_t:CDS:10 [Ambispora leptoticha]
MYRKSYLLLCLILLALEATAKPNIKNLEKEDLAFSDFLIKQAEIADQYDSEEHRVGDLPWANGELPLERHYAGYIHIRSFEAFQKKGNASLWLQGGPGSSSMIGLFNEMGPFNVTSDMKLIRNSHTWNKNYGMLFIDQPVGTGYSFVDPPCQTILTDAESSHVYQCQGENDGNHWKHKKSTSLEQTIIRKIESFFISRKSHHTKNDDPCYMEGYASNQKGISKDLLVFLQKFYQRYPEQKLGELYIAGESYAGKYVPSFATAIHKHNTYLRQYRKYGDIFPLAGIAIGSGLTDPITQVKVLGEQAYQFGLVSRSDADHINQLAAQVVIQIQKNDFLGAREIRNRMFGYWQNVTGIMNYYDIRRTKMQNDWSLMERFLNIPEIKKAVNVGNRRYYKDASGDIMKSTAHLFPMLIENYKVVLFQGNMDFRDGVVGNSEWLYSLEFKGAEIFRKKPRKIWRIDDNVVGYSTQSRNLSRIIFLQSGHYIPLDQPIASLEMITRFIENDPF